jgi:hypothetical protein
MSAAQSNNSNDADNTQKRRLVPSLKNKADNNGLSGFEWLIN